MAAARARWPAVAATSLHVLRTLQHRRVRFWASLDTACRWRLGRREHLHTEASDAGTPVAAGAEPRGIATAHDLSDGQRAPVAGARTVPGVAQTVLAGSGHRRWPC